MSQKCEQFSYGTFRGIILGFLIPHIQHHFFFTVEFYLWNVLLFRLFSIAAVARLNPLSVNQHDPPPDTRRLPFISLTSEVFAFVQHGEPPPLACRKEPARGLGARAHDLLPVRLPVDYAREAPGQWARRSRSSYTWCTSCSGKVAVLPVWRYGERRRQGRLWCMRRSRSIPWMAPGRARYVVGIITPCDVFVYMYI